MEFIRRNVNANNNTATTVSGGYSTSTGSGALETHTIFSQPFNGTNDVKGNLADVDNITANGDISTDGKLIIRGKDDDGVYTDQNLEISVDDSGTLIEGGKEYFFDGDVNAPVFIGDTITANDAIFKEATANNLTVVNNLTANKLSATLAEITKILSGTIEVDNLTVKKAAHFFKLIIDEIKSVGGQIIISPANATFDLVLVDGDNYKCYFRAEDGDRKIDNQFELDDQVVCQTFNATEGENLNASNKFYWRLVVGKGVEELNGIKYHYILLSDSDKDNDSNGVPMYNDKVALLGNRSDTSRQNAIIISAYSSAFLDSGIDAPFIVQYSGINNYNLSTHRNSIISNGKNLFTGDFVLQSGENVSGVISELRKVDNSISLLVQEPDSVNMFEYSNGDNYGCWKAYGSTALSKKYDTDYILALGGTSGGYILQPSKYYIKTNSIELQLNVSELQGLASYYSAEICDVSGTVISNKLPLQVGTNWYTFTLNKIPDDIVNLKLSVAANARLAFKNEKALIKSVPKRLSEIEVDIDSITSTVSGVQGQISTITQKADSIESMVSNLKIGGANLIDDSEFATYKTSATKWHKENATCSKGYGYMNQLGLHLTSNAVNNGSAGYLDFVEQTLTYKLKPDTFYTFSFYAKGTDGTGTDSKGASFNYKGRITTYVYPEVGTEIADNMHTFNLTGEWKRYSYTFKTVADLDESRNLGYLFRLIKTTENGTAYYSNAYICMPKLEEGTVATAWCTTDIDMKSYITQQAELIESKIMSEDKVKSIISQSTSNIKAEVYDEMNESTGINIETGQITLNADKLVLDGDIKIKNADEGLIVYDTDNKARVLIQNKKIPTISNLDTPTYKIYTISTFGSMFGNDVAYFTSKAQKLDSVKIGDTYTVYGTLWFATNVSGNSGTMVTLNSTSYLEYRYILKNTTTGTTITTPTRYIKSTADVLDGSPTQSSTFDITEDGEYELQLDMTYIKPTVTSNIYLRWEVDVNKTMAQYTQIGTDGIVSVRGEKQYLYFGNDGFEIKMNNFNGLRLTKNKCQQILSHSGTSGVTLWGSLGSFCELITNPNRVTLAVTTGGTSQGNKAVVRADGQYYDKDMFVFDSLSSEVWVKLPSGLLNVNGVNYSMPTGRIIRIKNLTSQKCYVYCDSAQIIHTFATGNNYYCSIDKANATFIWDGTRWICFL